jgi:ABC-type nitrate/sulfonate/bicarbonate transport system ATPase subunit
MGFAGLENAVSAFELCEISVEYGAHRVLDHVSLAVEPGEVVALAGPSGSGKTTMLRVLLGLTEPSAGTVAVRGAPAAGAIERRGLGMIFQDLALWPHLSARRNVAFAVRDPARVEMALRSVGLEAVADRRPGELSGGERQRLAIARALAPEPSALLLDEPLSSLDVELKHEILQRAQVGRLVRLARSARGARARGSDRDPGGWPHRTNRNFSGARAGAGVTFRARVCRRRAGGGVMRKIVVAVLAASISSSVARAEDKTMRFDQDKVDAPPAGFTSARTGGGRDGKWIVRAVKDSPSAGNVLAQVDNDDTNNRYAIAVFDGASFKDGRVAVKCRSLDGKVDQACGLVFRYQDANNYYLTRSNALENNVRIYHVKNGKRTELESWTGAVSSRAWHDLAVEAKGDQFQVFFDGKKVLEAKDDTFTAAGKAGMWTKADSIIEFDDFTISAR